jgi:DNA-binding XRE family transcriptional regulator
MNHDLLHIQGKPFVLVPLHDYRMMSTNTDDSDDLPETLLDALHTGQESPVKILRKHRDMTQDDLAVASGISRPYLTEIETRKKTGSLRAIQALAKALNVAPALLMPKTV